MKNKIKKFQNPFGPLDYKKQMSVIKYDENGLPYTELLSTEVTPRKNITDYSQVQDMRPTNDTEQERRWYTAQNARKRKAALPYVGAALSLPLLLGGAAPAIASEAFAPTVGKALEFGMKAMLPSTYITNTFGNGYKAQYAANLADGLLNSAATAEVVNRFRLNPNFRNSTELGLAALPLLTVPEKMMKTVKASDLAKRKFFPVAEYGEQPIYSEQTMPIINIRNKRGLSTSPSEDIVYLEYNIGKENMNTQQVLSDMAKRFKESSHGRAVAFDEYESLSTDSYPLALAYFKRLQNQGKGKFFLPKSIEAKPMIRLNKFGNRPITQETVDWINLKIAESGFDIPKAELVKDFSGRAEIRVSPIGFFKYKNGAKLLENNQFANSK